MTGDGIQNVKNKCDALADRMEAIANSLPEVDGHGTEKAVIHDHFDGASNCVECDGRCALAGSDRLATSLVRYIVETWVAGFSSPNMMIVFAIQEAGLSLEHLKRRAKEASRGNIKPLRLRRCGENTVGSVSE